MLMTGQLSRLGLNTRPLVGVGFALVALGAWRMAGMNLQVSIAHGDETQRSDVVRLRDDFPEHHGRRIVMRVSRANRLRGELVTTCCANTGAAIGIAFMTNSLISREQVQSIVSWSSTSRFLMLGDSGKDDAPWGGAGVRVSP